MRMGTNEARSLLGLLKKAGRKKKFPVISHRLPFSHWEIVQMFPVILYVTWIITKPKAESNYRVRDIKAKSNKM